ncbi:MAG: NAD(P)/FAD-dependent oxidoreductase [Parvibaculum sp.]|nr:NAD(P)/FAD-dependent oxidoreductase [Parvibaculum sp.]
MTLAISRGPKVETKTVEIAILGAGMGGLGMAAKLRRAGIDSFVILEKGSDVGGTWRDNHYPGSGCDVPSHLYSFSFEPKLDWTRKFAKQPEIHDYQLHVTKKYGLRPFIRFNTEVTESRFDEASALWHITTATGETFKANLVVSALGQLNRPAYPKIDGMDNFRGEKFHSARWDHNVDLTGKNVSVIGNGASAIQFVPEIVDQVKKLNIFQRSPNWVVPKADRPYTAFEQTMFNRFPLLVKLHRWMIYLTLERNFLAFIRGSFFSKLFEKAGLKELDTYITDPKLKEILTPDYPAGCKRVLISNDWYPAIAKPNCETLTSHIAKITENAIVTEDGVSHPTDVVIYSTGFQTMDFLAPMKVIGLGGKDLNDVWRNGAEAHRGVAVSGFPNFFMLYGPNTNLGHNSIIFMLECQINYILDAVSTLQNPKVRWLDVRKVAETEFNKELQADMQRTVWAGGCSSWYKNEAGKVTNNWSSFTAKYWWQMRHLDLDEYALVG